MAVSCVNCLLRIVKPALQGRQSFSERRMTVVQQDGERVRLRMGEVVAGKFFQAIHQRPGTADGPGREGIGFELVLAAHGESQQAGDDAERLIQDSEEHKAHADGGAGHSKRGKESG